MTPPDLNHPEHQFLRASLLLQRKRNVLTWSSIALFLIGIGIAFTLTVRANATSKREAAINKAKELESKAAFLTNGNPVDAFLGFHVAVEAEARLLALGLQPTVANSILARDLEKYPEYQTINTPNGEVLMGLSDEEAFAFYIDFETKSIKVRKGLTDEVLTSAPLPRSLSTAISELGPAAFVGGLPLFKFTRNGNLIFVACPANLHFAYNFTQRSGMLYRLEQTNARTFQLNPIRSEVQLASFEANDARIVYSQGGKLIVEDIATDHRIMALRLESPILAMEFTHDRRYLSAMTMDTLFLIDLSSKSIVYQHGYKVTLQGAQALGYIGNGVFGTNLDLSEQPQLMPPSQMPSFSPGPYGDDFSGLPFAEANPMVSIANLRSLPFIIDLNDKKGFFQKNPQFKTPDYSNIALSTFGLPLNFPLTDSTCNLLSSLNQTRSVFSDGTTIRIMDPVYDEDASIVVPDCHFLNWGISPTSNLLYFRSPECTSRTQFYRIAKSTSDFNRKFRTISKDIFLNDNPRYLTTSASDEVAFWNWEGELQLAIKKVEKYPYEDHGEIYYNQDSSLVCLATRFRAFFADLSKGVVLDEVPLEGATFWGWTGKRSYCLYKDISPDLTDDPANGFRIGKSIWTSRFTFEVRDVLSQHPLWKRTFEKHLIRYRISENVIRGDHLYFFEKDKVSEDYFDSTGRYSVCAIDLSTGNTSFTIPFAEGRILSQMSIGEDGTSAIFQFASQDETNSKERWDLLSRKFVGYSSDDRQFSRAYPKKNLLVTMTSNALFGISLANKDTLWRQARMNGRYWPDQAGTHFGLSTKDTLSIFTIGSCKKIGEIIRPQITLTEVTFQNKYNVVAYTDGDKYLVVADFKTNQEMIRLPIADIMGDLNFPNRLQFSPDGERIEAWIKGSDTTSNYLLIKSWYWRPQKLMELACKRLPRDFTPGQMLDLLGKAQLSQCTCHRENR